jgi:hypothetical protein
MSSATTPAQPAKLALDVLIKHEPPGKVSATVLGLPDYRAEGSDRNSALVALQQLLADSLSEAEIVLTEVEIPKRENPWLKMAGQFKDDPHFDEMLADIEAYRCELDAEAERRTFKVDTSHQLE